MNKVTYSALAVLMAAGLSVAVDAQARERGVNERQSSQRDRVASGARSGEVTRPESHRLQREARGIERKEQAFRSDGHFSKGERREVHRDLDRHGRHINQARNDHDRPGWHGGRDWGHDRGNARGNDRRHDRGNDRGHGIHGASGIDRLQHRQQQQIRQGMRNGSLTRPEAQRLYAEQRAIAGQERAYRADGVLTGDERRDLYAELRDANRHIYNQSHDDDRRYGW